jgi:hypothetical protein
MSILQMIEHRECLMISQRACKLASAAAFVRQCTKDERTSAVRVHKDLLEYIRR